MIFKIKSELFILDIEIRKITNFNRNGHKKTRNQGRGSIVNQNVF